MENKKKYRHEFKYMLNKGWYEILRQRVKPVMKPDSHGNNGIYRITSLYLDDVFDSAYNDKLMGLDVRKKYRTACLPNLSVWRSRKRRARWCRSAR